MSSLKEKIISAVTPVIEEEEAELIDVEIIGGPSNRIFRFFVDTKNGITVGECATINRKIYSLINKESLAAPDSYRVEVSSPGLDRALKEKKDFLRNMGKKLRIVFRDEDGAKQKVEGFLEDVSETEIRIVDKMDSLTIPYKIIVKARRAIEW